MTHNLNSHDIKPQFKVSNNLFEVCVLLQCPAKGATFIDYKQIHTHTHMIELRRRYIIQ